jgi:hypothetical protein
MAAIAFTAMIAVGCSGGSSKPSVVSTVPPSTSFAGATVQPTSEPPSRQIGDTAKVGEAEVTAHGSRTSTGDESGTPNPGNIWVIVDVTVRNTDTGLAYSLLTTAQIGVRDTQGSEYSGLTGPSLQVPLKGGEIKPNSEVRGEVAFEVPQNTLSGLLFFFRSAAGEQARWKLY